jgi:hypothetical protein
MTVADLAPIELFALLITAAVYSGLWLLGLREVRSAEGPFRSKIIATAGLIAGIAVPTVIGLGLLAYR